LGIIFGRKGASSRSNMFFGICMSDRIEVTATDSNELRNQLLQNIVVTKSDGTTSTYQNLQHLFNDYPNGILIVRRCPQQIGDKYLISETPVKDNNGFVVRYKCKYSGCDECDSNSMIANDCQLGYCGGFSKFLVACNENGNCVYYDRNGNKINVSSIKKWLCDCKDPVWVLKQVDDVFKIVAYSKKDHKICHSAMLEIEEFVSSVNAVNCSDKIELSEGINIINDETGNGINITIVPEPEDDYSECDIVEIYVDDKLYFSDTYGEIVAHGATISIAGTGFVSAHKITYTIRRT